MWMEFEYNKYLDIINCAQILKSPFPSEKCLNLRLR
jgi:hypothetical protein